MKSKNGIFYGEVPMETKKSRLQIDAEKSGKIYMLNWAECGYILGKANVSYDGVTLSEGIMADLYEWGECRHSYIIFDKPFPKSYGEAMELFDDPDLRKVNISRCAHSLINGKYAYLKNP